MGSRSTTGGGWRKGCSPAIIDAAKREWDSWNHLGHQTGWFPTEQTGPATSPADANPRPWIRAKDRSGAARPPYPRRPECGTPAGSRAISPLPIASRPDPRPPKGDVVPAVEGCRVEDLALPFDRYSQAPRSCRCVRRMASAPEFDPGGRVRATSGSTRPGRERPGRVGLGFLPPLSPPDIV